jgi:hypothetical protein
MLLAAVAGAAVASILISQTGEMSRRKQRKDAAGIVSEKAREDRRYRQHTGIVGDESEITEIITKPGSVVKTTPGYDSYGAPCVWLQLRNGAIYRSYDLENSKIVVGH